MSNNAFANVNGKLGFGYMRLPMENGSFDTQSVHAMADRFMELGFTYFDTAFVYTGSEVALCESLVKRYPRESFQIATKLAIMGGITKPEQQREQFDISLSRLGVDYVDYYLIHGIDGKYAELADKLDTWGYMRAMKAEGRAKHIGFSFHGTPEVLDELLTKHPEIEFVQLQINYLDWENPAVRSRELYEAARRHNKPITVMEPCKGGLLAGEVSDAAKLMSKYNPESSVASWAFRYVLGLEGVAVVLSGMGEPYQLEDNAKTFKTFTPLNKEEMAIIDEAVKIMNASPRIPCTACKYCVEHCPQKISIPGFIKVYNDYLVHREDRASRYQYKLNSGFGGTPKDCIKCRICETHCPQHIEISEVFDNVVRDLA